MGILTSLFNPATLLVRALRGVAAGATAAGILAAATPDPTHPFSWSALGAAFGGGFVSVFIGAGEPNAAK